MHALLSTFSVWCVPSQSQQQQQQQAFLPGHDALDASGTEDVHCTPYVYLCLCCFAGRRRTSLQAPQGATVTVRPCQGHCSSKTIEPCNTANTRQGCLGPYGYGMQISHLRFSLRAFTLRAFTRPVVGGRFTHWLPFLDGIRFNSACASGRHALLSTRPPRLAQLAPCVQALAQIAQEEASPVVGECGNPHGCPSRWLRTTL